MTVEENLQLGFIACEPNKRTYRSRRDEVMGYFPILRDRSKQAAGTLSGGEQQMLVVARALMSAPKLLLVDELSLGLAPKIVTQIFDILSTVHELGTSVLIVEQFVHTALENTDRAYVLRKGEVVAEGRSEELLADPALIASYLGEASAVA
jgi:branched-chain amino acid transport system ATP-binding protein